MNIGGNLLHSCPIFGVFDIFDLVRFVDQKYQCTDRQWGYWITGGDWFQTISLHLHILWLYHVAMFDLAFKTIKLKIRGPKYILKLPDHISPSPYPLALQPSNTLQCFKTTKLEIRRRPKLTMSPQLHISSGCTTFYHPALKLSLFVL